MFYNTSVLMDSNNYIIVIQALTTITAYTLIEQLRIGKRIKKILKRSSAEYVKPYDCRFCLYFWTGVLFSSFYIFTLNLEGFIIFQALNLISAKLYEHLYSN